jgi:hypothetical protein
MPHGPAITPAVDKVPKNSSEEVWSGGGRSTEKKGRGQDNQARKVGMYLVKEQCDLRLQEITERFRTGSYGTVAWAFHGVTFRMASDANLPEPVSRMRRSCQQEL